MKHAVQWSPLPLEEWPFRNIKKLWGQSAQREQFMWKGKDDTVIQRRKQKKWESPNVQALGKSRKKKLPFRRKKPRPEPGQLNWLLLLWRSCSSPWVPAEGLSSAAPTHKQEPFPLQSGHSLTSHLLILIPVSSYLLSCKLDVTKNQIWQANQSSHPYWKNGTQTFTFSTCLWDTSLLRR